MAQPSLNDPDTGTTVSLQVTEALPESVPAKVVELEVPERTGNVLQLLGRGAIRFSVVGFTTVLADRNQLRSWSAANTLLNYNDDATTDLRVVIYGFKSGQRPGWQSTYYDYSFELVEV